MLKPPRPILPAVLALILATASQLACSRASTASAGEAPQPAAAERSGAGLEPVKGEWPQYRGPDRDGISPEKGLRKEWPAGGPPVQWRAAVGEGYSGIAVARGLVFTMFNRGGSEWLAAFDSSDGSEKWAYKLDSAYKNSFGNGPRATPTVDGSTVFAVGAKGKLVAVEADTGKLLWRRDLVDEMGARVPQWGVSSSPLVEGDLLLLDVGGRGGRSMAAFAKRTGETVWATGDDGAGYSSPIAFTVGGVRQAVFFTATRIAGVAVEDGRELWARPWKTAYDVNAAAPIFIPPNRLFVSSGYDVGAAVYEIGTTEGGGFELTEVWKVRNLKNQFSSSVRVGDTLYGFDDGTFKAVRLSDGEDLWRKRGFGHGSLIYADGHLIVLGDEGTLALVEASPEAYREKASVEVFQGKCWTLPTLVGGRLFVRDEKELLSLDLSA